MAIPQVPIVIRRRCFLAPSSVSHSDRRPQSPANPAEKARRKLAPKTIPCSAVQTSLVVNSIVDLLQNPDATLKRGKCFGIVIRYNDGMLKTWIGTVKRG